MISEADSARSIENKLAEEFAAIHWVGELPLTRSEFDILAAAVRAQQKPQYVSACMLVTSMVFCARYAEFAEDEHVGFWSKYLRDVWKTDNDPNFQTECREQFRRSRDELQERYGFEFPGKDQSKQDVISGIYLHAILPSYLQDDFADFFLSVLPKYEDWQRLQDLQDAEIAQQLQQGAAKLALRRLKHFITDADTSLTAVRLIKVLAITALRYSEGLEESAIRESLAPIEQAIWDQLAKKLQRSVQPGSGGRRAPAARTQWAWLYDENDILELQVRNLPLGPGQAPDRLVWLPQDAAHDIRPGAPVPKYGAHYCEVNAWNTDAGYRIDSGTLIDVDEGGVVVPVDRTDNALSAPLPTRELPAEDIVFFRIQADQRLALHIDRSALSDGRYAISRSAAVGMCDPGSDQPPTKQRTLMVPRVLKSRGHVQAGVYDIKLPIRIGSETIQRQITRQMPALSGEKRVAGLEPGALPVFESGEVWISFTQPKNAALGRMQIRLTVNEQSVTNVLLTELQENGEVQRGEDDILRVCLSRRLPGACLFQAEVFNGTRRMNSEPLIGAILPDGVGVRPSNPQQYYTIDQRPVITIDGVTEDQIELASDADVSAHGNSVQITWRDPRQDAALRLRLPHVSIPLTFETHWAHAWVDPLNDMLLWEEDLPDAVLHVRGKPRAHFVIQAEDQQPRHYDLNARGVFDTRIGDDALVDSLREYYGGKVPVTLRFTADALPIPLFTLIRWKHMALESKPEPVRRAIRAFRDQLRAERGRRPASTERSGLLCLLPPDEAAEIACEKLPSPVREMQAVRQRDYAEFEGTLLPQRSYQLQLSTESRYALKRNGAGYTFELDRLTSEGPRKKTLTLSIGDDGGLWSRDDQLRQCEHCLDLYWSDDRSARSKHGHGRFSIQPFLPSAQPLRGQLVMTMPSLEQITAFKPTLSKLHDSGAEHYFRLDPSSTKRAREQKRSDDPLSVDFYRHATAQWRLRSDYAANLEKLLKSSDIVRRTLDRIAGTQTPALACAAGIIQALLPDKDGWGWGWLDPTVLTLALLARSLAHGADSQLADDDTPTFEKLLNDAQHHCPELLTWALCLTELIFTHWSITES